MIEVEFFATIRELTGEKQSTVENTRTVGDLLRLLSARYGPLLKEEIFDGDLLSDRVTILVNGMHIASTGELDTPLAEGDSVSLFPIVGGG